MQVETSGVPDAGFITPEMMRMCAQSMANWTPEQMQQMVAMAQGSPPWVSSGQPGASSDRFNQATSAMQVSS